MKATTEPPRLGPLALAALRAYASLPLEDPGLVDLCLVAAALDDLGLDERQTERAYGWLAFLSSEEYRAGLAESLAPLSDEERAQARQDVEHDVMKTTAQALRGLVDSLAAHGHEKESI